MDSTSGRGIPGGVIVGALVTAAVAWLALLTALVVVVPRYQLLFRDFGMKLPWAAEVVVAASDLASRAWPLALVGLVLLLVAVAVAAGSLARQRATRGLAYALLAAVLLMPLVAAGVGALALQTAVAKLQEGLSR